VLFHDDKVDRVSDGVGMLSSYTLDELKSLKIFGSNTTGFYDRIITFREFLEKFSSYNINFAIELKGPDVESETLELVKEFKILHKTTFTSFNFDYIKEIKELDFNARVGYLTDDMSDEVLLRLRSIGAEEIAPKAELVTEELMKKWRSLGLGVRAWGVFDVALMKKMCAFEVDGMTVNFPDRLQQYLTKNSNF